MALRGKKPEAIQKRLKALFYGEPGAGKTTAAIQLPRPYLIDTERGAENQQYADLITKRGGVVFQTNDFDDIVAEVTALLSEPHDYRTLVIDPITTVYDDLIEKAERKVGSEFGRHYSEAKKQWKRLGNLLLRLDMNVVITSHQKNLYGDAMKILGKTYDGPKGLDYMFDLVFEVAKRGSDRVGVVKKTRMTEFPEGDVFPFNYEELSQRYGKVNLEREATTVQLATPEQVAALTELLSARKDGDDLLEKWLTKAMADTVEELPSDAADKCIAFLTSKKAVMA
jgi:DNA polymerase III delta prime subunit